MFPFEQVIYKLMAASSSLYLDKFDKIGSVLSELGSNLSNVRVSCKHFDDDIPS